VVFKPTVADHPAVANMSLGGSASSSLDTAVRNSIADGVTYCIAAGNNGATNVSRTPTLRWNPSHGPHRGRWG
jgi:subtilisin family serine protease